MTRTTDHGSEARVSRREAVGLLATGAATLGARLPAAAAATETPPVPGLIRAENAKPGTRDWMLAHVEIDPAATYRSPAIEGYCSHASVLAGDTLTIHVSTRPARPFTIDLYRMGWYGGDGGRLVASLGAFAGTSRDDPPVGAKRLRRCTWPATTAVTIPVDWPSGAYVGKLACRGDEAAPGPQSYVVFIVRDTRPADLVFQCSDFTWQAYNRWPDQFALYDDGDQKWYWGRPRDRGHRTHAVGAREAQRRHVHGHRLRRPARQRRVQRRDLLVGRRTLGAPGLRPPERLHKPPGPRRPSPSDHGQRPRAYALRALTRHGRTPGFGGATNP
jgi:hypothetical protein